MAMCLFSAGKEVYLEENRLRRQSRILQTKDPNWPNNQQKNIWIFFVGVKTVVWSDNLKELSHNVDVYIYIHIEREREM